MLEGLPENPCILNKGCGPRIQTIMLEVSWNKTIALDFHQPFLEQLAKSSKKEEIHDKIKPVLGDMFNLTFENSSFDLIWSEGQSS